MQEEELIAVAAEIRAMTLMIVKIAGRDAEQRLSATHPGISPLQFSLLRMLVHHSQTITELSRKLFLNPATLVPVVDALETNGHLIRQQDPHDRRRTPLALTDQGRRVLEHSHIIDGNDALYRSLAEMGDANVLQLHSLLRDIAIRMSGDEIKLDEFVQHIRAMVCLPPNIGVSSAESLRKKSDQQE